MKKMVTVIGLLSCLLSLPVMAGMTQAKDLNKQAELLMSCQRIQQYPKLPAGTSAEQRALVALNIAVAQSQLPYESIDLGEMLRRARSLTTYLVQSDTFYLWETDHWEGSHRSTYTYSGIRQISEVEQDWDSASARWVNAYQTLMTYNGDGTPNTWTQQEWQTDQWVNVCLMSFTYSGGMTDTMLWQIWSGSAWVDYSRSTLSYYEGRLATVISELWQTGAWVNSNKTLYTYSSGNLSEFVMQSWVGGVWTNSVRMTYSYNGSGWETESFMYTWVSGAWMSMNKYAYTYDGSGNEILFLYSTAAGPTWIAMEADTSKWSGGKNTEIVHNHMLPTPSVFRSQYTYDSNGNKTVDLGQDLSGSEWVNTDRAVYVYQAVGACGDFDVSSDVDIADVVYLVSYIFSGGAVPRDVREGDADCDLSVNIADVVYLVAYIFSGGPEPCANCP